MTTANAEKPLYFQFAVDSLGKHESNTGYTYADSAANLVNARLDRFRKGQASWTESGNKLLKWANVTDRPLPSTDEVEALLGRALDSTIPDNWTHSYDVNNILYGPNGQNYFQGKDKDTILQMYVDRFAAALVIAKEKPEITTALHHWASLAAALRYLDEAKNVVVQAPISEPKVEVKPTVIKITKLPDFGQLVPELLTKLSASQEVTLEAPISSIDGIIRQLLEQYQNKLPHGIKIGIKDIDLTPTKQGVACKISANAIKVISFPVSLSFILRNELILNDISLSNLNINPSKIPGFNLQELLSNLIGNTTIGKVLDQRVNHLLEQRQVPQRLDFHPQISGDSLQIAVSKQQT